MYVSMTGFSRAQIQRSWGTVSLEMSSVNHRYQEISVRLPREFSSWEPWFHQKLRKGFRRGKLQVRMEVLWAPTFRMGRINKEVMTSYCEELLQIQRVLGQAKDLQLESVVTLPGVLDIPSLEDISGAEELESSFSELIEAGLKSWQKMRETGGGHLKDEVLGHLSELGRNFTRTAPPAAVPPEPISTIGGKATLAWRMARFLMDKHPAHVEPLIRRWLGLRDHYSNA